MKLFETKEEYKTFWNNLPLLASTRPIQIGLTEDERRLTAKTILLILDEFYVHLPQKISALAINPLQQARILNDDSRYILSDLEFYQRIQLIANGLRDRHTSFTLPAPWRDMMAILPFTFESYWEGDERKVVLSKLAIDVEDPEFVEGITITHWNGIPIATYIQNLSWETSGAHPWARVAVAFRSLTVRPLAYMKPPDEDWAQITYNTGTGYKSVAVPWKVYIPRLDSNEVGKTGKVLGGLAGILKGVDDNTLRINYVWRDLYSRSEVDRPSALFKGINTSAGSAPANLLENNLFYSTVDTRNGTFAYIRIFSFDSDDIGQFVNGFAAILTSLPSAGLIIDVRSNPGGSIPCGEAIVQLLAGTQIEPSTLTFRNTTGIVDLVNSTQMLDSWKRSVNMLLDTGQIFSQGFALTDIGQVQPLGHVYKGKVVIIIDSLCYSTTDFFAAAIQDNGIGKIIGVDPITGAGGANVWTYAVLSSFMAANQNKELLPFPRGADMNISMRQALRVRANAGLPIEGIGVSADFVYKPTKRDVLSNNEDLIEFSAEVLSKM